MKRRYFVKRFAASALAAALLPAARAAELAAEPAPVPGAPIAGGKPVHVLVGFPPGGGTDTVARLLADKLAVQLGQPVVVDNRPGAGGQIAAQLLKNARPDGLTLFFSHDHTISILPLVVRQPGFDPVKDFTQVAGVASFANTFAVSAATPASSLDEYMTWARQQDGRGSSVGIPAPASVPEFLVKVLSQKYGADLLPVPYRGTAPMVADMLGNQISAGIGSVPEFIENHRAGKLRVLATLGPQRQKTLPEVPTFAELGLRGFEDLPYYGFFAPKGTPQDALDALSEAIRRVMADPGVQDRLDRIGLTPEYMSAAQLTARARAYEKTWSRIIRESGFQPQ